jgi:hypothetical protein
LPFPAANTGRSLELLETLGSCKVTELDDLAPFLVDDAEAEALGLQTIPSEKEEGGAAAADEAAESSNSRREQVAQRGRLV